MITVENRPAVPLQCLTAEELVSYGQQYAVTALEKELVSNLIDAIDQMGVSKDGYCLCCGSPT